MSKVVKLHYEVLEKNKLTIMGRCDYWSFAGDVECEPGDEYIALDALKRKYEGETIRIVKITKEYFT